MTEGETRELCHRFFDAIEQRDVDTAAACYAPNLQFWFNITRGTSTKEQNVKALTEGYARHRRRVYNDRRIHTFDGGFMMQYTCHIVRLDGGTQSFAACVVAQCSDGLITRIDEYMDSGKFPAESQAAFKAVRAAVEKQS